MSASDVMDLFVRPVWHSRAVCKGVGNTLFYPDRGQDNLVAVVKAQFCDRCPVTAECLAAADRHGTWAGLSPGERDRLKTAMREAG